VKIVMLCDFYNELLEYQENLLAKYYVKHGHDVTIITSTFESVFDYYADRHNSDTSSRVYNHGGAKIIKLKYRLNILNRLRVFTKIDCILDQEKPDLIFIHDIMLNIPEIVKYIKKNSECKVIMDYHADYSNSGKNALSLKILHGVIRKWFLDQVRPYLKKIFPIVPAGATFLHEVYKIPYSEMELLPLGADTDLGREIKRQQAGRVLRQSFGISEDDIVIFSGGKLTPTKKTELLIEAVARLSDVRIHVIVIGDASQEHDIYKNDLLKLAQENSNIRFTGWLDRVDIYRYLDMADLAVFPASQSILWQQAIAMGLPLIVGDTGHQDISYLNMHHNIIILDKAEIQADQLAMAIKSVISDAGRMHEMSEGAARVAEEYLNWDSLILKTLKFN